jgi:hypothetical protein
LRTDEIFAEFVGAAESPNTAMKVTFARDLVTPIDDLAHQLGHLVSDRSEDEKCGGDFKIIQEIERLAGIRFDAALESIPVIAVHDSLERGDVKVVFQHDRQEM